MVTGDDSMASLRNITAWTIITLLFAIAFLPACAQAQSGKQIDLDITYGAKQPSERVYDVLANPKMKVKDGQTGRMKVEKPDEKFGFEIEITPTIGKDNPNLIILKIKAWELRDVSKSDGKAQKEYVEIIDQTSRVRNGATVICGLKAAIDRDVQVTITSIIKNAGKTDIQEENAQ
jgi:hypothetical protein